MKRRSICVALLAILCASLSLAGTASAVTRAATTVTIKAQNGDISGTVSSPRPLRCANNRKIAVFKQVGAVQNPQVDTRVGSDSASLQNGVYVWSIGNSGTFGKVYARAIQTPLCKGDTSPTIRSVH